MKKEIVQYATGKFKHFDGQDREFTVCMVSTSPIAKLIPSDYDGVMISSNVTAAVTENSEFITAWERYVNFGTSVRNPQDAYNEGIAKKIAYGKSISDRNTNVLLGRAGLLNIETVKYILDNEVNHVKQYPEQYSVAYAKAKDKYEKAKALAQKAALYNKAVAD